MNYQAIIIDKKHYYKEFIHLPWKIYKNDPYWVPPLRFEIRRKLDPNKNPFFEYGQVRLFGVTDQGGRLVGRGAAIINPVHNDRYQDRTGFFGMFECIDDREAAKMLLDRIVDDLRANGCDKVVGPVNFTTNDESGILVEGFDSSPVFMTNYSPRYYDALLTACGFEKEIDSFSFQWVMEHKYPEKYSHLIDSIRKRTGIQIRHIDRDRLDEEMETIMRIYNESFDDVWGFVPLSRAEVADMGRGFERIADEDFILFAESGGEPVGLYLTLPDINVALKGMNGRLFPLGFLRFRNNRKRIKTARILVLCVLPQYRPTGVGMMLIHQLQEVGVQKGYTHAEAAVVLETNARMIRVLESLGFQIVKRYRIYRAAIPPSVNDLVDAESS